MCRSPPPPPPPRSATSALAQHFSAGAAVARHPPPPKQTPWRRPWNRISFENPCLTEMRPWLSQWRHHVSIYTKADSWLFSLGGISFVSSLTISNHEFRYLGVTSSCFPNFQAVLLTIANRECRSNGAVETGHFCSHAVPSWVSCVTNDVECSADFFFLCIVVWV